MWKYLKKSSSFLIFWKIFLEVNSYGNLHSLNLRKQATTIFILINCITLYVLIILFNLLQDVDFKRINLANNLYIKVLSMVTHLNQIFVD